MTKQPPYRAKPYCFFHLLYFGGTHEASVPKKEKELCREGYLAVDVERERAEHEKKINELTKVAFGRQALWALARKAATFEKRAEAAEQKLAEHKKEKEKWLSNCKVNQDIAEAAEARVKELEAENKEWAQKIYFWANAMDLGMPVSRGALKAIAKQLEKMRT